MASSSNTLGADSEDWVLVPDIDDRDAEPEPQIAQKPLFQFHFGFELGPSRSQYMHDTQHHGHRRCLPNQPGTKVPQEQLEKSLPVKDQHESRLFTLPLEIRLHIYSLVLRLPYADGFGARMLQRPSSSKPYTVLSVLSTCRRALHEAEHILYAENRLCIDNLNFLRSLKPRRRDAIKALAITAQSGAMVLAALEALAQEPKLPNLLSLHIVRRTSIRFLDLSSWTLLKSQIVVQAQRLGPLQDFHIFTPEATNLSAHDIARKEKLDVIDDQLRRALQAGFEATETVTVTVTE